MIDPKLINELTEKLTAIIPPSAQALCNDLKKNVESILQASLGKMNLVTREEFDAQVQVLARTREKLEALAAELDQLEHKHSDKPHHKKTDH